MVFGKPTAVGGIVAKQVIDERGQPSNALAPIDSTELPMTMLDNPHVENALSPIDVTESGILTFVKP